MPPNYYYIPISINMKYLSPNRSLFPDIQHSLHPPCVNCWDDSYDIENSNILYYLLFNQIPKRIMEINDVTTRSKIRKTIITNSKNTYRVKQCNLGNHHLFFLKEQCAYRVPMLRQTLALLEKFHHGQNLMESIHNNDHEMKRQIHHYPYYACYIEKYINKFLINCQICRKDKILKISESQESFEDIYQQIEQIEQNRLIMKYEKQEIIDLRTVVFDPHICFYDCREDSYDENWDAVLKFVCKNQLPDSAYGGTYEEKSQITRTLQAKKKKMFVKKCSRGTEHIWKITSNTNTTGQVRIPMTNESTLLLRILHGEEHHNMNQMIDLLKTKTYYSQSDVKKIILKRLDMCEKCEDLSNINRSHPYVDYAYIKNFQKNISNTYGLQGEYFAVRRGRRGRRPRKNGLSISSSSLYDSTEKILSNSQSSNERNELYIERERAKHWNKKVRSINNLENVSDQMSDSEDHFAVFKNSNFQTENFDHKPSIHQSQLGKQQSDLIDVDNLIETIREQLSTCQSEIVLEPISTSDQSKNRRNKGFIVFTRSMISNYIQYGENLRFQNFRRAEPQMKKWYIGTTAVEDSTGNYVLAGIICLVQITKEGMDVAISTYFHVLSLQLSKHSSVNQIEPYSIVLAYNCQLFYSLENIKTSDNASKIKLKNTVILFAKEQILEPIKQMIRNEPYIDLIQYSIQQVTKPGNTNIADIDKAINQLKYICQNQGIIQHFSQSKKLYFREYSQDHVFYGSDLPQLQYHSSYNSILQNSKSQNTLGVIYRLIELAEPNTKAPQTLELNKELQSIFYKVSGKIYEAIVKAYQKAKNLIVSESNIGNISIVYDPQNDKNNTLEYQLESDCWRCSCRYIYYVGLPCRHIMSVLTKYNGEILYYISSRWLISDHSLMTPS